ncbi:MAG: ATP-binding cassette domain-containing protein [Phycisphaeraceae bacterium]|nr:MAG: ATP-binding cassette domain-containing protein [Phycisphaeraceae bacterium]
MSATHGARLLRAMAPFGLEINRCGRPEAVASAAAGAEPLIGALSPGRVALLTGPSGAGKSVLLGAVWRRLGDRGSGIGDQGAEVVRAHRVRLDARRAVAEHRVSMPLDDWLGLLSMAGLADARVLATPAGRLSDGERARLRLAVAMSRFGAPRPAGSGWLLVDECCSTLDRETAAGVAATLRRWATRTGTRVIAASAHADLIGLLGPDLVVRCEAGGARRFEAGPGVARGPRVRIEAGTTADYKALARFHYRPGRPASPSRVLRAVVKSGGGERLAGVLVVTHPTLNGSWRESIWPGRYVGTDKARVARRINRELRRISRVVIDPRDRGRGIARRLVRAYLDDPDTPATEAVAAMGRLSPFGEAAGMTTYPLAPRAADDRLDDMLHAAGVEPWELLDPARVERVRPDAFVRRELEVWARAVASSIPKPRRGWTDVFDLAPLAAGRLCAPPVAWGAVRSSRSSDRRTQSSYSERARACS